MFGDVTFAQAPFAALGGNTILAAVDETASASTALAQLSTRGAVQLESSTAAHAQAVQAVMQAIQAELAAPTDAVSSFGSVLKAVIAESAASTAAVARTVDAVATQSEGVQASALPSTTAILYAAVLEQVLGTDAEIGQRILPVAIAEGASGQAVAGVVVIRVGLISEAAGVSVVLTPLREANVRPAGIQLFVNIGGVLVWVEIDDTQNPNWQNIVNAQGSGWAAINDTQSPDWTNLPS